MLDGDQPVADAVEELLRYLSVVQVAFPRFARHDMELFGQHIKAGDVVMFSLSGANRDPRLGPGMGEFDPRRHGAPTWRSGTASTAAWAPSWPGWSSARPTRRLLRRFPELRLEVPAADLTFRKLSLVYGVEHLPVRLGPTA